MSKLSIYKEEALTRFINSRPDYKWDFGVLSSHPDLNPRVLEIFSDREWNWSKVIHNKNFEWKWVKLLPNKPWPWADFPFHPDFVWRWVYELPESPWDWRALSHIITSCWQILHFSDKPWDWTVLTLNEYATMRFIMMHPEFPWVIGELFFTVVNQPTIHFLRMFRDRYTPVDWIDHTKHAKWNIIKANMDLPWDLASIKWQHGDLCLADIEFIRDNQKTLNMELISSLLNYNGLIRVAHGIEWDLGGLSKNPTFCSCHLPENIDGYNLNLVRLSDDCDRWYATQTIQRYWKRTITDPGRKMCRDVFLRDMSKLSV